MIIHKVQTFKHILYFISPISINCLNAIQECALNDSASIHFDSSIGGYLHKLFCNQMWNQIVGIFAALAVLALILLLHLSSASTASFFHSAKNVTSLFFCEDFIKYFDHRLNPNKQVRLGAIFNSKLYKYKELFLASKIKNTSLIH